MDRLWVSATSEGVLKVIRDHSVPIARILPFRHGPRQEQEALLVASGAMKMPEEQMNWKAFFNVRSGDVSQNASVQAVIESRGDR